MGKHYFKKPKKIVKNKQQFHDEVIAQADEIYTRWLTKRPLKTLPKITSYPTTEIQAGAFKIHFPGFYRMSEVLQLSDWHTDTAMDHTIRSLKKTRTMIKRISKLEPTQHEVISKYFKEEVWGETRQTWFDWLMLFHDCGKLATYFIVRRQTQFVTHEMAGAQLLKKWLFAVEIPPQAEVYLLNMVTAHSTIHNLMDDHELSHKGILIHARKHFSNYQVLELLLLTTADLFASQLKKNNPKEYKRRMNICEKALPELIEIINEEKLAEAAEEAWIRKEAKMTALQEEKRRLYSNSLTGKVKALLENAVDSKVFPGASVVVITGDEPPTYITRGFLNYGIKGRKQVSELTIYDVASVTKSVVTSTLALQFIQNGVISIDSPISVWESESHELTFRHLLTHTASFAGAFSDLKEFPAQEILARVRKAPLQEKPGTSYAYINTTSVLLGLEVEKIGGSSLESLAKENIFHKARMHDTTYGRVSEENYTRVAPTEIDNWREKTIRGEVHDEGSWKLLTNTTADEQPAPFFSGAAGVFTTAKDIGSYMYSFLNQEFVSGDLLAHLSQDQRTFVAKDHTTPIGLGWELAQPHWMGTRAAAENFIGKTGFTGCCMIMNPAQRIGIALLCNHIYPKRPTNRDAINAFRSALFDVILENIS